MMQYKGPDSHSLCKYIRQNSVNLCTLYHLIQVMSRKNAAQPMCILIYSKKSLPLTAGEILLILFYTKRN